MLNYRLSYLSTNSFPIDTKICLGRLVLYEQTMKRKLESFQNTVL